MTAFEEMGVLPEIGRAIEEMDWALPTDIQAEAIPLILGGGDVLMAAETGSGKTAAFVIPLIQSVWESLRKIPDSSSAKPSQNNTSECRLSVYDRDSGLAVTPDGLRCQSRDQRAWLGGRATRGAQAGCRAYFEATVTDEGLCRVGWALQQASMDLGTCPQGWGFGGTGRKSNSKQFDEYGEAYGMGDVIGCWIDLVDGEVGFMKNGKDLGVAFQVRDKRGPYFPAVVLKNAEMSFNFGTESMKHLPSGYTAVAKLQDKFLATSQVGTASVNKKVNNAPQAIVIEPSRELAEQTYSQINKLKTHLTNPSLSTLLLIGGVNVRDQTQALQAGVDVVVCTPGRLEDLIHGGQLSLAQCRVFVLDEADGLLKQGYETLIGRLHKMMDTLQLQMVVCSATLHNFQVNNLAKKMMRYPTWVDLKGEDCVPETVHHVVVMVDPLADPSWRNLRRHVTTDGVHARANPSDQSETLSEGIKLLKAEYCLRAIREHKMDRAILFCRTKLDCDNLEKYLINVGRDELSCVCLHGDRKPAERRENLEMFKQSQVKFLICTDVASRGLDISGLPYIVNVCLPDEKESYVHRIGRVGRADRMGLAISLVASVPEKVWYHGEWCKSRGRSCQDTRLTTDKPPGCCVWYQEKQYLADIEEHLNVTIQQVGMDIKVPVDEFDGKVSYGQKRQQTGSQYQSHVTQMAPAVEELASLESKSQLVYLKRHMLKQR